MAIFGVTALIQCLSGTSKSPGVGTRPFYGDNKEMRRSLRRSDARPDSKPRGFLGGLTGSGPASNPGSPSSSGWFRLPGNAQASKTGSIFGETTHDAGLTVMGVRWWGQRNPWLTMGIPLLALLATIAGVLAVYHLTRRSSEQIAGSNLESILSANTAAMELWLDDQQHLAQEVVEQPEIQSMLVTLLDDPAPSDSESRRDIDRIRDDITARFDESIGGLENAAASDLLGWVVLDDRCQPILQSRNLIVDRAADLVAAQERAYESRTAIAPPVMVRTRQNKKLPAMAAMSSVRRGVRPVGTFALLLTPSGRFTELLSIARTGQSGETYAFNSAGQLISRSRFEDQLAEIGLIDSNGDTFEPGSSILKVKVRDPGTNLLLASESARAAALKQNNSFDPTRMAASAIEGNAATDTTGYRDYRGVEVIGVWRWMDRYGFGIASEIDADEAFEPLNLIRLVMMTTLTMLALAGTGLVGASYLVHRLVRRQASIQSDMKQLGQYELFEVIGKGGMGTVYRGRHELLARDVAVKVLEDNHNESFMTTLGDQRARIRFEREVQLTSLLRHPNTINIYDFGRTADDVFFYVMEFIEGVDLKRLLRVDGAQPPGRVIHLLTQICGSIQEAHSRDLIHRDIKPGNIVLTNFCGSYDMVKVLDFGLVRSISQNDVDGSQLRTVTPADAITGTPMYMAPEVIRDSTKADRRTDIYAIGAVGYQLLAGLAPYVGESIAEVCAKRLKQDPDRPSIRTGKKLPEDLQDVLMSCLRADPDERPQSAEDLAKALRKCSDAGSWKESDALTWWNSPSEELQPRRPITLDELSSQQTLATLGRGGFTKHQLDTTNPQYDGSSETAKATLDSDQSDATVSFKATDFDLGPTRSEPMSESEPRKEN